MSVTGYKSYSQSNITGVNTTTDSVTSLTASINTLTQQVAGITYNATSDLTTIDNNVTITGTLTTTPALCTSAYVDVKIAALVASAPTTLDTLNELAVALGNDPNYATSTATLIGTKASLTATQTISGVNTLSNPSNVFYGDGSHLTNLASGSISTVPFKISTGTPNFKIQG